MPETDKIVQAEQQTAVSKTKKYNDLPWSVNIYLTDMYTYKTVELETDNIDSITITNNLLILVPKVIIEYTDNNNILTPYVKKNGMILTIDMYTENLKDNTLYNTFYVDKFTVLNDPTNPKRTVTRYSIVRN